MPETLTYRKINYKYGAGPYTGSREGYLTWDQLEARIRDERWGFPYTVTERLEREDTIGDWKDVT